MGFKENLRSKMAINHLAEQVLRSWGTSDSPGRMDRQAMQELLELSDFEYRRERDLDLYCQDRQDGLPWILVLDNELKLYHTAIEDVILRKSPTVKEMVSIRNAIKILNDAAVVVSRKQDTLERLRQDLIAALDLTHTQEDIADLASDGCNALTHNYAEGVIEILTLFAELLEYRPAPKAFAAPHCRIWGRLQGTPTGDSLFGPMVIFNQMDNSLKMIREALSAKDREALERLAQVVGGTRQADLEGEAVLKALAEET